MNRTALQRAVFLDRDGVLLRTFGDGPAQRGPRTLSEMELLPGVRQACRRLLAFGPLICVTNQPDLSRGLLHRLDLDAVHDRLMRELPLADIYVCGHDAGQNCDCRKPRPGLLFAAAFDWHVCLRGSVLVGDRPADIAAGRAAGCRTVLLDPQCGDATRADLISPDLLSAAEWILGGATGDKVTR